MKKYVAFAMQTTHKGNNALTSMVLTKGAATEWARDHVAKNNNTKAYVCEVLSVVSRPDPVVMVLPFMPEAELVTDLTHDA